MMIMDLNNIIFSSLNIRGSKTEINDVAIRYLILDSIRQLNRKFRNEFGTLVIATDSLKYWRREFFPYYKASRKRAREDSDINWPKVFEAMDIIKEEIRTILPYKYIEVSGAEADDIIGTLCYGHQFYSSGEKILILSNDKDFMQLQIFPYVRQYDPVKKVWLHCDDPEGYIVEHVIKGDFGDGIPNILSPDNCLVTKERQKKITSEKLEQFSKTVFDETHENYQNWKRNYTLIHLSQVPDNIKNEILRQFHEPNPKNRSNLMKFFMSKNLRNLIETLNDF